MNGKRIDFKERAQKKVHSYQTSNYCERKDKFESHNCNRLHNAPHTLLRGLEIFRVPTRHSHAYLDATPGKGEF